MKVALAIALVVVVAATVDCAPSISGQSKRQGGEKDGWPSAWIEFSQLIGKCEEARNWMEALNITISEEDAEYCVLGRACQKAYGLAIIYNGATEEEQGQIEGLIKKIFPLLQCTNLEAEREGVSLSLWFNGKDAEDDVYLKESAPLFGLCEKALGEFKEEEKQLEELFAEAGDKVDKKREFQRELQRLLSIVAKKR